MRSVCETIFHSNYSLTSSDASFESRVYEKEHKRKRCTCTRYPLLETPKLSVDRVAKIRNFNFELGLHNLTHDNSRALTKPYPKSTIVITAFHYCGAMLAGAIRASITINRGAGGISISPVLNIARTVPNDSRAFQLVDWELPLKKRFEASAISRYFYAIALRSFSIYFVPATHLHAMLMRRVTHFLKCVSA